MTDPSRTVLAIDIGGTKIAFADIEDNKPRNRHQIRTPRTGRGEDLVGAIVARGRPTPSVDNRRRHHRDRVRTDACRR